MKKILSFFLTIDKALNIGVLISFLCVILVEFVFLNTEEMFSGGARLGDILSSLSLAYIASYIFYVVVVHYKKISDKKNIDPHIVLKSAQIVNAVRVPIQHLIWNVDESSEYRFLNQEELNDIASQTHSLAPAPEAYRRAAIVTMSDFFYYWKRLCQERLDNIFLLTPYLEPEHIKLLLALQENSFFNMIDSQGYTHINCSFGDISSSLFDLSESARKLDNYCNNNFENY